MENEKTINAASNPALANQLVEEALTERAAPRDISVATPPDTVVELAGGLFDPFEGVIRTAEVRELTGADEEVIARIGDNGKALLAILERAVVKIGDKKADKDMLDMMLAGDRELLLLAIRRFTFGEETKIGPGNCPHCSVEQTFDINLKDDIKVKTLDEEDRDFTVDCKVGKVSVRLPNGHVQKAIVAATGKNAAELDTILLKGCIQAINGNPAVTTEHVKNLSIKDRREIIKQITDRNPGPQLAEVSKPCQSCGQEVPLPLTLAELFQG